MVNDISIISGIIIFFIACAVLLPYVNDAFLNTSPVNDVVGLQDNIGNELSEAGKSTGIFGLIFPEWVVQTGKVASSVFLMFFWSFQMPLLVELLIFVPLRIILVLILARNIWVGGGG